MPLPPKILSCSSPHPHFLFWLSSEKFAAVPWDCTPPATQTQIENAIFDLPLDGMRPPTSSLKRRQAEKMMWASYFSTSVVSRPRVNTTKDSFLTLGPRKRKHNASPRD